MNFSVDNLITAVSTITASALSGILAWLATRKSDKIVSLVEENAKYRSSLKAALEQVEAYHFQEGLMAAKISEFTRRSVKNTKTEFRDQVIRAGYTRPDMTALQARSAISELKEGAGDSKAS